MTFRRTCNPWVDRDPWRPAINLPETISSRANGVTTVLCDADGTLFPSEEPAYTASAVVVQAFAERYGLVGDFTAENLRRIGTGRNFRAMAEHFRQDAGIAVDPDALQQWVDRERSEVTAHLAQRPDASARRPRRRG